MYNFTFAEYLHVVFDVLNKHNLTDAFQKYLRQAYIKNFAKHPYKSHIVSYAMHLYNEGNPTEFITKAFNWGQGLMCIVWSDLDMEFRRAFNNTFVVGKIH